MINYTKDPFGGVGSEFQFKSLSPFKIDKEDAQREIQKSLETWKKKEKEIKSFFQKFHKYKTKPLLEEENISHWSFCEGSNNYVDIHLLWSKKIIKTLKNVKVEKVKTALLGLKRFYSQISSVRPDFSNPYILECYNQTAKNYQLPEKKLKFKNDIEVKILDPFADVRGENVVLSLNDFYKDKKKALEEIEFSIKHFEHIDIDKEKKDLRLFKKPRNYSQCYKTSTNFFNIYFFWGGSLIKSVERVNKEKTLVALTSLKTFIESVDTNKPNLKDPIVKLMYESSILKNKPKQGKKKIKEMLPVDEGGFSYWSYKNHKWVTGKFDKKNNKFIKPKKDL